MHQASQARFDMLDRCGEQHECERHRGQEQADFVMDELDREQQDGAGPDRDAQPDDRLAAWVAHPRACIRAR